MFSFVFYWVFPNNRQENDAKLFLLVVQTIVVFKKEILMFFNRFLGFIITHIGRAV